MRFRLKLFLVSLALILGCVAVADAYLTPRVGAQVSASIRDDLVVRARLVAREVGTFPAPESDVAAWDALADAQGAAAGARVTLISRAGVVLGDSEVALGALRGVENHRDRPEVRRALEADVGEAERLSVTVSVPFLYVAVPFWHGAEIAGVARVAKPLSAVDAAKTSMRRAIGWGTALAVVVAIVMSGLASRRMSGAVEDLTRVARKLTQGDLAVRTRVKGSDEIASLGRALDALAESLSRTLGELRTERDRLGSILEGMQEGVLLLDDAGGVILVNAASRAMLGLGNDVRGLPLVEVVRDAALHELLDRVREGGASVPGEIELPGATPRRLMVHASPLAGHQPGLLVVFVDVTELARLESIRRDFVANVSHELRTPVAAIQSAAETLEGGALDEPEPARKFVGIVGRNAARLRALIEDLLELSRIESKESRARKEPVDVAEIAAGVVGLAKDRAEKKGVALRNTVAPIRVTGDPMAIEQILANLVDNAVKYCPAGAVVTVSGARAGDRVAIRVADTGPGIDARHLPRIFERFYRVDPSRSRELGGTGLGLSIVKHLAEAMRGTVRVESRLGKGSTFTVDLPPA